VNALKAPFLILGYIGTLFGLSTLSEAPDASETVLTAPPSTMQVYQYGEIPLEALTADTSTTTSTTVWIDPTPKSECEEALQIALDVGWPPEELATLARVLWRESRCSFGPVLNPDDPMGGSYGLTQVNGFWCTPSTAWPIGWLQAKGIVTECVDLYGAETNLRAALEIWRNSSWHPWGIK
jgi:hypothetical protein